jgi:hypothetical protein
MKPATGGMRPRLGPSERPVPQDIDRRRFLLAAGGAAVYLTLGPALAAAKKLPDSRPGLQPWALPDELPGNPVDAARALIGAAVLAPSDWNTQPWRFEVEGNLIRVVADARRALPVTDPDRRGMMIGLGAALENMLIAARAWGQRPTVHYLPHDGARGVVAEVSWMNGETRRDRALFGSIPDRRTHRNDFDERGIFPQNRALLMAEAMEGLQFHWLDDPDRIRTVADLAYESTRSQVADARAQAEQFGWMRFDNDAEKRGDGVPVGALELSGPAGWLAGRYFRPGSWFQRFGTAHAAKQARGQVRSAGALLLITAPRQDETQCMLCGQSYERVALKATHLGIANQILSAPVEVSRLRPELRRAFQAPANEEPLLFVRLGHAKRPDPSPRRAVSVVSTFRNT